MTIEAAIVTLIETNPNICGGIIHAFPLPQDALVTARTALTYQRISAIRDRNLNIGPAGRTTSRFQFDIWGKTYAEVKTEQKALKAFLDGYQGVVDSFKILSVRAVREEDSFEDGQLFYRAICDYIFAHQTTG